jgi:DNA polymerase III epsilon subunit family exonuclease
MAHGKGDICGCFPTGLPYPGIAEFLLTAPPAQLGLAEELAVDGPWEKVPLAVIDTETTGKDAARGDRIVEVAVVHCCDGAVTERHGFLINPGIPIPAEASAVHGIRDEDVKDKPRFEALAPTLLKLLAGRVPVAYNAGFDRGFLRAEFRRAGVAPSKGTDTPPALRLGLDWIDPLLWARGLQVNVKGFKLGEVAARVGIDLSNAHRATDDAEAAAKVLYALLQSEAGLTYRKLIARQRGLAAGAAGRGNWRR